MGVVWRAEDVKVGRVVALKVILDEAPDRKTQARFLAEAKAAASIAGPNVAEVLDFGVDRGTPYLAMELLSGESLATRLTRDARLSGRSTAQVISGAAAALERAHALGIVHRDLKPSNLHLTLDASGVELVKVLDLGIAKFLADGASEGVTIPGTIVGTTSYMSPERSAAARRRNPVASRAARISSS